MEDDNKHTRIACIRAVHGHRLSGPASLGLLHLGYFSLRIIIFQKLHTSKVQTSRLRHEINIISETSLIWLTRAC